MKKIISATLILIMLVFSVSSCAEPKRSDGDLKIVCTTFPQYDFLKNILGNDDSLILLLDDGADLHSYEPTAQDIIDIGSADIFVCIGGSSDVWVENAIKAANNPDLKAIALMDFVNVLKEEYVSGMEHEHKEHEEAHGGNHSEEDEHIWLSLKNAEIIVQKLCDCVCEKDGDNAEKYKANAENYISMLNELDNEFQNVVSSAKRKTILFADRFPFRYLTEDYGLTYYAAFAGCSAESEASFDTLAFLINKVKELSLPVVFTIENSDGSIAQTVCGETGAKVLSLNSCQSISISDIENGATYIDIMKENLLAIKEALN